MSNGTKFDQGKPEALYMYLAPYGAMHQDTKLMEAIEDLIKALIAKYSSAEGQIRLVEEIIIDEYFDGKFPLEQICLVSAFGAKRYGLFNYQKGLKYSQLINALLRHYFAFEGGEDVAPDSGLSHHAHMLANVYLLRYQMTYHEELNDLLDLNEPEITKEECTEQQKTYGYSAAYDEYVAELDKLKNQNQFTG